MMSRSAFQVAGLLLLASGCGDDPAPRPSWELVHASLPGALMSVWGTSPTDVWAVGADAGSGPTVLHFDGADWSEVETGTEGDLWWVFGFANGPVYMGGSGGTILRYAGGELTRMTTPGTGVVFGIWGASENDLWAVGGEAGGSRGAFAWRLEPASDTWQLAPGFPPGLAETDALWKVSGAGPDDVWMVGTGGKAVHFDGQALTESFIGLAESLFTVHASARRFAAAGGFGTGLLLEREAGSSASDPWTDVSPADAPALIGVCLGESGGYAVGEFGYVARRTADGWSGEETGFELELGVRSLHSVWIDPEGGVWAAGGQIRVPPLVDGVLLHKPRD